MEHQQQQQQPLNAVEIELADWVVVRLLGGQLLLFALGAALVAQRVWREQRLVRQQFDRGIALHQVLSRILESTQADRVVLFEVCDSSRRLFGGHQLRCCLVAEARRPQVASFPDREIPVERLWAEWGDLRQGSLRRYSRSTAEPHCRAYLARLGVAEQWAQAVIRNGLPVALLAIQFLSARRRDPPRSLDELLAQLNKLL